MNGVGFLSVKWVIMWNTFPRSPLCSVCYYFSNEHMLSWCPTGLSVWFISTQLNQSARRPVSMFPCHFKQRACTQPCQRPVRWYSRDQQQIKICIIFFTDVSSFRTHMHILHSVCQTLLPKALYSAFTQYIFNLHVCFKGIKPVVCTQSSMSKDLWTFELDETGFVHTQLRALCLNSHCVSTDHETLQIKYYSFRDRRESDTHTKNERYL